MDNNHYRLPNSQWNPYQNPASSTFRTNASNNLPVEANNVWRQSLNVNNSANRHSHVNEVNYRNSNLQVSGNSMYNPTQSYRSLDIIPDFMDDSDDDELPVFRRYTLPNFAEENHSRFRYILPVNLQNSRVIEPEEPVANYSGGNTQSAANSSHGSIISNASNEYLLLNRRSNQPADSASTLPLQRPTSYQNSASSQTSTVTSSLDHRTFSPMNHFNHSYNLPPPPTNNTGNSAPVILNQNQYSQPPQMPLGISHFPPNNSISSELPLSIQVAPPVPCHSQPLSYTVVDPIPKVEKTAWYIPTYMSCNWEVDEKLSTFLKGISQYNEKPRSRIISITKFREVLKEALETMKNLVICRENLVKLLKSDRDIWNAEVNQVFFFQHQLDNLCTLLHMPGNITFVQNKLYRIAKKRKRKKMLKQKVLNDKLKQLKIREELHHEIDKWLDSIKEKNLKLKREAEMKKEADSILSEVRRKIHEARRTIEKIKLLEKLRSARQAKAINKGLFLPEHDEKFQNSSSNLRELMLRQLSDYEAEEKALKVMLEAEQEGQLEEEALWKIKKLRSLQQKRQSNILECLFGDTVEEPVKEDPMFLFYQFQNSGNKSIESLTQIRHQWDVHINEEGDSIPQQWVVPVPPSSSAWEVALKS